MEYVCSHCWTTLVASSHWALSCVSRVLIVAWSSTIFSSISLLWVASKSPRRILLSSDSISSSACWFLSNSDVNSSFSLATASRIFSIASLRASDSAIRARRFKISSSLVPDSIRTASRSSTFCWSSEFRTRISPISLVRILTCSSRWASSNWSDSTTLDWSSYLFSISNACIRLRIVSSSISFESNLEVTRSNCARTSSRSCSNCTMVDACSCDSSKRNSKLAMVSFNFSISLSLAATSARRRLDCVSSTAMLPVSETLLSFSWAFNSLFCSVSEDICSASIWWCSTALLIQSCAESLASLRLRISCCSTSISSYFLPSLCTAASSSWIRVSRTDISADSRWVIISSSERLLTIWLSIASSRFCNETISFAWLSCGWSWTVAAGDAVICCFNPSISLVIACIRSTAIDIHSSAACASCRIRSFSARNVDTSVEPTCMCASLSCFGVLYSVEDGTLVVLVLACWRYSVSKFVYAWLSAIISSRSESRSNPMSVSCALDLLNSFRNASIVASRSANSDACLLSIAFTSALKLSIVFSKSTFLDVTAFNISSNSVGVLSTRCFHVANCLSEAMHLMIWIPKHVRELHWQNRWIRPIQRSLVTLCHDDPPHVGEYVMTFPSE